MPLQAEQPARLGLAEGHAVAERGPLAFQSGHDGDDDFLDQRLKGRGIDAEG
jgi:hypothetical protein